MEVKIWTCDYMLIKSVQKGNVFGEYEYMLEVINTACVFELNWCYCLLSVGDCPKEYSRQSSTERK